MSEILSPQETERILRERAAALAKRHKKAQARTAYADVTIVRRAGATLGLPTGRVVEIRQVSVTALPHASGAVNGLFQIRGQVYCLLDAGSLLGATQPIGHGETTLVALIDGEQGKIGLRVDEAVGARTVYEDELDAELTARRNDFITGVTRDLLAIVNVDAFLARPEIFVEI